MDDLRIFASAYVIKDNVGDLRSLANVQIIIYVIQSERRDELRVSDDEQLHTNVLFEWACNSNNIKQKAQTSFVENMYFLFV